MYNYELHQHVHQLLLKQGIDPAGSDNLFYSRFIANMSNLRELYQGLYEPHPYAEDSFRQLLQTVAEAYRHRPDPMKERDILKEKENHWYLSNAITGMSLYVDRFAADLEGLERKLPYFRELGVNLLHLMPIFESPEGQSDGGYAVSDFRKIAARFGQMSDLQGLQAQMSEAGMYLMLDIVLNHTSDKHNWALKARQGDPYYQEFFYFFPDRRMPDLFEASMPEIFPESAPGNFTWVEDCHQWVITVFHQYQWDLNFTNPRVLVRVLDTIFFYANLGVDILRIDAPAFIWKEPGTSCQNLPQAHRILRLIRQAVEIATPGMALLAEAIVAPFEIMKYFGTERFAGMECQFAYNATHMALQWDALASGETGVMQAAQPELLRKPEGCSWITYTRCHDDIGLGYEDYMIEQAGKQPFAHRKFLKDYYSGIFPGSPASGALFSVNHKTQDARISGTLASLCGLEKALESGSPSAIEESIQKILMMQAHSFLLGGIPMIFYGDETGFTNDYHFLEDPSRNYDNRWMHRPRIDWNKNERRYQSASVEERIFSGTKKLIRLRHSMPALADHRNLRWLKTRNAHVAAYLRDYAGQRLLCLFNFCNRNTQVTMKLFREAGFTSRRFFDYWQEKETNWLAEDEQLFLEAYQFRIFGDA